MAFCLPNTDPDPEHLLQAMRACWKDGSDQTFDAFFGLFKQLMQADLARYTSKVALVDQVCDESRDEIRREFSLREEMNFDYALLFRAIAYSHYSHTLGDRGVSKVLQNAKCPMPVGPTGTGHDMCIVAFEVLLTLEGNCRGKLLDLSLEVGTASVEADCFAALKAQFNRL
jgi:hypothetical protein